MTAISRDARGFVKGIVDYLESEEKTREVAPKVETLLHKMTAKARKGQHAVVETVVAMNQEELGLVRAALEKALGHEISIENTVQPALIGGMRITLADWVLDTSFRNQLQQMVDHILR